MPPPTIPFAGPLSPPPIGGPITPIIPPPALPPPPVIGAWTLSNYSAGVDLEETEPDKWEGTEHYTLVRWRNEEVSGAIVGAQGSKGTAIVFQVAGVGYTTAAGRIFLCTADEIQPFDPATPHLRRMQTWEHINAPKSIDLKTLVPMPGAPGGTWALESHRRGIELDEIAYGVWQKMDHDVITRTRNEAFGTSFAEAAGSIISGVPCNVGPKACMVSGLHICITDEITLVSDALGIVHRVQMWEHYSDRVNISPPYSATVP